MNEELVQRVMNAAQRIQALSPIPDRPPKTIEQLAFEVREAVKIYALDKEWAEWSDYAGYPSDAWCGIQIEAGEFHVGWGTEDEPEEPFSPKPTIREALYEALRAMVEYHTEIAARKAQLEQDSLE